MDQSYSESDISMSPSQILERLQILRQLQLMQRGKLQKQRLQYQETTESSSCITEMISHFTNSTNSTSYNTFRSLLQTSQNIPGDASPRLNATDISQKLHEKDLIEGVSVLNLSQESEFIVNSPTSGRSRVSDNLKPQTKEPLEYNENVMIGKSTKKHISLVEMPILTPKNDFESLVIEKLENDKTAIKINNSKQESNSIKKQPYLRRGEGMARFGVKKNDLVIMSTKSLPWKTKKVTSKCSKPVQPMQKQPNSNNDKLDVDIIIPPLKLDAVHKNDPVVINQPSKNNDIRNGSSISSAHINNKQQQSHDCDTSNCSTHSQLTETKIPDLVMHKPTGKHPALAKKGKTWASILTTEQSDFLAQLKQSEYYKNFTSPTKSTVSDMSCDENSSKLRQEKEAAEQNLFDLLENKVSHESFSINSSFFNRLLRKNHLECSGESTPIVMQKCLAQNPNLMHIYPNTNKHRTESCTDADTCQSDYTDCRSDACSSVSSSCSCKTIEPATPQPCKKNKGKVPIKKGTKEIQIQPNQPAKNCQEKTDKECEVMKANMEEMNAKLITTSDLLKERLRELEDEIETFRKENMTLNKMKEEVDSERHKFYEEKSNFEQKFNEEKIISEYYLAEEKEKLNKQKQMYERYVREIRGRLNKKEKDEVLNLRQEIHNLKEEIRNKDAKYTSTTARLRNQIKIMEKEKTELQKEVEKLKKENRRIQHSNEITRRLSNMKYLEQINKKLSDMNKETLPEVESSSDIKYKAFEIERQSRSRKVKQNNNTVRPRAKSVPNLKVTSRYAKYFSQRDAFTANDRPNVTLNDEKYDARYDSYDNDDASTDTDNENSEFKFDNAACGNDNNLETIYRETFGSRAPKHSRSDINTNNLSDHNSAQSTNDFFLRKSNSGSSNRDSKSPINISISSNGSNSSNTKSENRSKSPPVSILSRKSNQKSPVSTHISANHSTQSNCTFSSKSASVSDTSQRSATVIHKDIYQDRLMAVSPEPSRSKTSLTKTSLHPTELRKPDGSRELRFPNGNVKYISADGKYCKFLYYNGDVKENFYNEGTIKYYYAENKIYHTTHPDGLEVLEFPDGQVEKRYADGSSEVRLANGCVRYRDPRDPHVREEWRHPGGAALTVAPGGERRLVLPGGRVEVHAADHKRREFPDGTVKLVYADGSAETRYASGRVRLRDRRGKLLLDTGAR